MMCDECGRREEVVQSVHDADPVVICHGPMVWAPTTVPTGRFAFTPGRETGAYEYDYGKKATWDLTPPGKYDRLRHDGVVENPFMDYDEEVRAGKIPSWRPAINHDVLEG